MADQNEIQSAVLSYLGDKKQETTQSLRVSFDTALGVNPDQEADLRKTASVLNIPVDSARAHPEEVRRQATMLTTNFDQIADQYPNTARFLAKQENANIAHDDVNNLSTTEKVVSALKDLKGDAIAGAYSASRGAAGIFKAGFELAAPVLDPLAGTVLPENPLRRVAAGFDALGKSADAGAKANRPKSEGIISSGINSGIESLSQNLLALPLAFVPGGQSAYLSSMVAPVAGNAYSDAREKGISPTESAVYGASQGLIEYATEKLPVQYLIKDLKVGSPFYKVIAHQMASEIPGEQIATVLQDLNDWAVLNPDKPFADYIAERPSAAAQTLIATVVGVGGQVTLAKGAQKLTDQFTGQSDQVRRAEYSAELLNQLNTLATASKLRARDTDSFQTFLQSALEDGEVDHVYIEPKVLQQTLEQAGIKMEDFAKTSPLVSAQLQESLATNTDLSIPITEFATQLAGQTYSQQLIQHLKTDPQGMSQVEAQEFIKTHGENLKTEVERILGESSQSQEFKASRDRVYQLVLDNLNETNRFTQQKNEIDATLISARTAVRAAQLGITPEDLFNKHLLKVTADTVAGDQVLQQPGQSAFGKKYEQFKGKAAQAVAKLKQAKSGEAIGALNHPDIGPIDLIWGEEGDAKNDYAGGYGLAKILAKHPELENKLQDILDGMTVKTKGKNRIILESKDHKSAISLNWKGQEKKWLLSAYDKGERGASGTTIYAAKDSQEGGSLPNAPEDIVDRILSDFNKSSYNQSGLKQTETQEFKKWSHDLPVIEMGESHDFKAGDGVVVQVLHGTTGDFDTFDQSKANIESDLGGGFYFTNTEDDVGTNYAGLGPDLTAKVQLLAERIASDTDREYDDPAVVKEAQEQFMQHEGMTMPVFVRFDNPVVLGGSNPTFLTYSSTYDEEYDDYSEPEGTLVDVMDALEKVANRSEYDSADAREAISAIYERAMDYEGLSAEDLIKIASESEGLAYATDENGVMANKEIIRLAFEMAGFDGFIDQTVNEKFGDARRTGKSMEGVNADTVHFIAFEPTQIKSSIGNNGQFNENNPSILNQAQRGQIAFGSDLSKSPSIITLLKSADLSTFLHESGHFFFESDINLAADLNRTAVEMGASFLTEGERQLMGDVSKMLEWHGLQGSLNDQLNQWYTLSPEEKRSYHERTAESFERYLFEGKAPSIELQRIFQAFRAWLMNVYKSIEDFVARNPEAGKLDDSIRQVFDRMLASSEQIQLAEHGRSMMPLFESADQAGMTTEEFAAYHALDLDASMQALSALEAKGLKDMQWLHNARGKIIKKLQKQNVDRRAEVMMDARREVLSQPIYKAWTFLTNRMDKDQKIVPDALPKSDKDTVTPEVDSMFTAIAKLGGLKRDEIDTLMGLDPKMKSPMPAFGKYVFKRNGGESLDFMGEILANYGYLTVDEHGKFDTRELEDKIDAELRGDPQYAVGVDPRLLGQEGRAGEGLNLEELGAGRLDFGELVGLPVPREQINQLEAMKMVAINGIHPDLVAEQFGISSGDELVQSILSMPNPKEAIANLTDQMMLERYGDITSPQALEQAADVAIHNEARAKFVATELNALNKATGKPKVLTSAAKEFAKNMIDRLIIRNLKPSPYAASEVRAAKAAEKALKEGKLEQAAADKRNQIINTYATKAVYDAQDEVEKGLRYLTKFDNEGTRKALDVDYLDQIDAILERFDLRKGTTLKNIDKRKSLAAWITQQEELGIEVDLPSKVKAEAYRQSYKDMTVEELRGLIESVKQIEHLGRLKEKLLTAQDNRRFTDIINQMVQSIDENANNRQIDNRTRDTLGNKAVRLFKGFFAAHRKTASLARELDGYKESGPMWEYLIRSMNQAGDHEATMRADATHRLSALLEPILKGGKFGGKGQYFPTLKESLNRGEQIVIALNMGNAGNQQRLLDGRGWQIEQLTPVMKNLTAADWNFVQNIWDFFESYRPMIAEKERRVMGKEPNWVEPQRLTVTTKEGTQLDLNGGYFPIVYDPRESGRAEQFADAEAAKQMMRGAFNAATTRRSFTKDRAEEVTGRPLILTWDALFRGVNDVIHDLTWHEWVIDANRIIKNESLDNAIRTGFGADVIAQFKSAITDIAKGDSPDMDAMSKVLTPLRSGAAVAGLGFNLMNSMLQPLGLTQSMVRIGTRWVGLGIVEWAKSPIGLVKQVHEKSEFMRNRARTLNREVNEVQSIVQGKGEIREKLDALMFAPMQSLQLVADMPTWWGAYQKALADPALMDAENGVDEATAIARADQAVIDSQGGGQIKDLAKVQRGGNLQKLFTVFYGYFSAAYNLGVDQTKKTNFKSPVEVMALAWDFLLLYSVPSVLASLLKDALMPSGAGDDDWEKIARKLASEQISYLMGLMVGLREATGAVQYLTGTKMFDTAYGGPAGLRFFQELDKLGKQIGQGDLDRALARSVINVGGIALHLPSAQINRTVDGVIALSEGKTENPLAVLFGYSKQ
jgi:hypothetical protein